MEKLLELIVKSIVQKPKAVKITKEVQPSYRPEEKADSQEKDGQINLRLKVDPEDIKIVIGKKGRTIRAIRNLLRLKAIKEKVLINLEIEDEKSRENLVSPKES